MFELLRKRFPLTIEVNGEKYKVVYEQATLRETIEFFYMQTKKEPQELVKDFLVNNGLSTEVCNKMGQPDLLEIYFIILDTYTKGYLNVRKLKERLEEASKEIEKKEEKEKGDPFYSLIGFLLEYTNETMESLMELTYEQITYMLKGIVWNQNSKTDKGKRDNQRNKLQEEVSEGEDIDTAKNRARKLKEKLENRKKQPLINKKT